MLKRKAKNEESHQGTPIIRKIHLLQVGVEDASTEAPAEASFKVVIESELHEHNQVALANGPTQPGWRGNWITVLCCW